MPADHIQYETPPPLYFFSGHSGHHRGYSGQQCQNHTTQEHRGAKSMSQGELGERPVPARCARMTLVHALTLNVDV